MSGEDKEEANFSDSTECLSPHQNYVNNEVAVSDTGGMGDGNDSPVSPRGKRNSWFRSEETNDPEILVPDHPLMKRFQDILKAHLERENQQLKEEVAELVCFFFCLFFYSICSSMWKNCCHGNLHTQFAFVFC